MTTLAGTLTDLFAVQSSIVLGPFGGMSSVGLTARVSELGGLGSYGLYGYGPERIEQTASALRTQTDRPFALNLWLPTGDEVSADEADLEGAAAACHELLAAVGAAPAARPRAFLPVFTDQFDAVLRARPAAVSFVYGVPSDAVVSAAHNAGIKVIGTATIVDEARALAAAGVDAVVAMGAEAAGHRVSFLGQAEQCLVGTFALVPQVVDAVSVPVIAAGGVADRRGVRAARALGAAGVQVGTAFLRTRQSAANESYRSAIAGTPAHGTVLTRAMSGRLARGIPNRAVRTLETADKIAGFPAQNWLTAQFRGPAADGDLAELQSLWAGQSAALATSTDVDEVFAELAAGLTDQQD